MYNAGKSSLLNALNASHADVDEAFKTGAARVTSTVSEVDVGDVTLVDTPGADGLAGDDETAWHGVLGSDCYLYVHRLMSAEFEQSELQFLKRLKDNVHGLESRIVLVIAQIDEVGDVDEAKRREAAIRGAFATAVGFMPRWTFSVSAMRYMKGKKEQKHGLVVLSGIPELLKWIVQLNGNSAQVDWRQFRADRAISDRNVLAAHILAKADGLDSQIEARTASHQKRLLSFEAATAALVQNVRESIQRIDSVE